MNKPEWRISDGAVPYAEALAVMEARVADIRAGRERELVWLLEHPPLYTAGTSSRPQDLLQPMRFPVHVAGRGGQYTYHGPGQRVGYVMLDVGRRFGDVRAYVAALETLIVDALAQLGVRAETLDGRVGVWVPRQDPGQDGHDKIGAIGVRLRRWVSSHGFSVNVAPDLEHFSGIVPRGIADAGATSLARLGVDAGLDQLDRALQAAFERNFGATCKADIDALALQPNGVFLSNGPGDPAAVTYAPPTVREIAAEGGVSRPSPCEPFWGKDCHLYRGVPTKYLF
jgi:lipoyl(octanoyl) transferase